MKIVSTTLTGNNGGIIGDALASIVDYVDLCIVIDTGVTDNSLKIAKEICGKKLIIEEFRWINDFSAARNFALDMARKHGADWSITVDTDERIRINFEYLQHTLLSTDAEVILASSTIGFYSKERLFRIPAQCRFEGPTHEACSASNTTLTDSVKFWELYKDESQEKAKFLRDIDILKAHTNKHPDDPRWHYYLGDSLLNTQQYKQAILSFRKCAELKGWKEESAWSCFKGAQCYENLSQYENMIEILSIGISRHPGIAELYWYAGYAASKLGWYTDAVYWSCVATTLGLYEGRGNEVPRIGFRHLPGLFEGPYDVMRFAYAALSQQKEAADAEHNYHQAIIAREQWQMRGK